MSPSKTGQDLLLLFIIVFKSGVFLIVIGIAASPKSFASEKDWSDSFSVHGEIKNETALRYIKPIAFTKMLNLLRLELRYFPSSKFQVTGLIYKFYDAVYDFQSVDNVAPRKNPRTILADNISGAELEALQVTNLRGVEIQNKNLESGNFFRELYVDIAFDQADFRIGRQIVRWGVLEGARVTDTINPLDFQEFILREVQDRYIPLWLVKGEFYAGRTTTELLWIPDLVFHRPASLGSEWEQLQSLDNLETPARNFRNSEAAIKLSGPVGQWDLSLSYFYTWDDFSAAFRTIDDPNEFGSSPEVVFGPRHARIHVFGGTFSKGFPGFVLNGELTYNVGKIFGTRIGGFNPATGRPGDVALLDLTLGELKRNFFKYGLSIDFRLAGFDLSLMAFQEYIMNYQPEVIQDEFDTFLSLFARKAFASDSIIFEMLIIHFINDIETLLRPKWTFRVSNSTKIALGADIFEGEIGGPLPGEFNFVGFFKNNDRIYMEISYGF